MAATVQTPTLSEALDLVGQAVVILEAAKNTAQAAAFGIATAPHPAEVAASQMGNVLEDLLGSVWAHMHTHDEDALRAAATRAGTSLAEVRASMRAVSA